MAKEKKQKKAPPHEKPVHIPLSFMDALKGLLSTTPKDLDKAEKKYQKEKTSD